MHGYLLLHRHNGNTDTGSPNWSFFLFARGFEKPSISSTLLVLELFGFCKALSAAYYIRFAGIELGLNDGQRVLCFQLVGCVIGLLCISRRGKAADMYGNYSAMAVTQSLLAVTPLLLLLVARCSIWIPLTYNIVAAFLNCCQTMLNTSLLLEKASREGNVIYIAVYSCSTQLLGAFPGALCGDVLLNCFRGILLGSAI